MLSWEKDRRQQLKLMKQICHFKPTLIKKRRVRRRGQDGEDLLDMKTRYASAGPNRHMFEMYNYTVGSSSQITNQQSNLAADNRLIQSQNNIYQASALQNQSSQSTNIDQSFSVPNQFFPAAHSAYHNPQNLQSNQISNSQNLAEYNDTAYAVGVSNESLPE